MIFACLGWVVAAFVVGCVVGFVAAAWVSK